MSRLDVIAHFERSLEKILAKTLEKIFTIRSNPEVFLFHPTSECKYIKVNAEKETLEIVCCPDVVECVCNSVDLKLTRQNLSELNFARDFLIKKHHERDIKRENEGKR